MGTFRRKIETGYSILAFRARPAPLAWKSIEDGDVSQGPRTRGAEGKRSLCDAPSATDDQGWGPVKSLDGEEASLISIRRAKRARLPPKRSLNDVDVDWEEPQDPPPLIIYFPSKFSIYSSLIFPVGPSHKSLSSLDRL